MDGQVSVDWYVADAALRLGEEHLLAPVRDQERRLEAAVELLVDQGIYEASLPKMPVYSTRCCSTASSDIAPVTLTERLVSLLRRGRVPLQPVEDCAHHMFRYALGLARLVGA